jgi:predicted nucleic acid-binding protein
MRPTRHGTVRQYVLDANALIALFEGRPIASEKVERLLAESLQQNVPLLMSAVNWGEVFYIEWRRHGEVGARAAELNLQQMPIAIIPVNRERASRAGALKQEHAIGYADAFAAELAIERGAWLVTADPEFRKDGESTLSVFAAAAREVTHKLQTNNQRLSAHDGLYALAASCPPSGRKYCVPLIGAETLRSNSCKSSLRSTKSISEVFTISRSDEV